jgi:hypothetical protein
MSTGSKLSLAARRQSLLAKKMIPAQATKNEKEIGKQDKNKDKDKGKENEKDRENDLAPVTLTATNPILDGNETAGLSVALDGHRTSPVIVAPAPLTPTLSKENNIFPVTRKLTMSLLFDNAEMEASDRPSAVLAPGDDRPAEHYGGDCINNNEQDAGLVEYEDIQSYGDSYDEDDEALVNHPLGLFDGVHSDERIGQHGASGDQNFDGMNTNGNQEVTNTDEEPFEDEFGSYSQEYDIGIEEDSPRDVDAITILSPSMTSTSALGSRRPGDPDSRRPSELNMSRKVSFSEDISQFYPEESTATVVPEPNLMVPKGVLPRTVTYLDDKLLEGFHNGQFDVESEHSADELGDSSTHSLSNEEIVKLKLREEKQRAKDHAERERHRKEAEYQAVLAVEEQQREERWKAKEVARVARQEAKLQAELESARLLQERCSKRKDEEQKLIKQEDDSFEELMRLRGSTGLILDTENVSHGEVHFLAKSLEANESIFSSNRSKVDTPVTPTNHAGSIAKDAKSALNSFLMKKTTIWDSEGDTPSLENGYGLSSDASTHQISQFSPFLQGKKTSTAPVPHLQRHSFSDALVTGIASLQQPGSVLDVPLDHNNHPMASGRVSKLGCLHLLVGQKQTVSINPLQNSSRNLNNSELRFVVKNILFPTQPLARRLQLWALTEGFIYTTPAEMDMESFAKSVRSTSGRLVASNQEDKVFMSLSEKSNKLLLLKDWNDLIASVRDAEQQYDCELTSTATEISRISVAVDVYFVPKPLAGITPVNSHHSHHAPNTNNDNGVPPMSKLCCEGFILEAEDDPESITTKVSEYFYHSLLRLTLVFSFARSFQHFPQRI